MALAELEEILSESSTSALIVQRRGEESFSYGDNQRKFASHSMRKSFLSALYGIAIQRGLVRLDQALSEFSCLASFELTQVEASATVHHLLSSTSAVYLPAAAADRELPARGSRKPGEEWFYNNWDFNSAQHILESLVGASVFEIFEEWIAGPIGMQDFSVEECFYVGSEDLLIKAGFFRISNRDLARFGELYRCKGIWGGTEIISPDWIEKSTAALSKTDLGNSYGYMWWRCLGGLALPGYYDAPDDLYMAWGWGGHFLVVVPSKHVVIAHRVNTDDSSSVVPVEFEQFGKMLRIVLGSIPG